MDTEKEHVARDRDLVRGCRAPGNRPGPASACAVAPKEQNLNLLLLAPSYPHPGDAFGGAFNHRCAVVLRKLCGAVEVVAPRPWAPRLLSRLSARWQVYAAIPASETRDGVLVIRPAYLQLPRIPVAFWSDLGSYLAIRQTVAGMHRRAQFDAILAFDLVATGSLAWRLGRHLNIPAASWSTQSVPITEQSVLAGSVLRAASGLDLMFYQSAEKRTEMANLLRVPESQLEPERHKVLARGVPEPPPLASAEVRARVRSELGIADDQILVLAIGRIDREKGVYEFFDAAAMATARDPRISVLLVGSRPALDETAAAEAQLDRIPGIRQHLRILPACRPEKVWEYLCAADLYAFPSQREGMPNSLLEAMSMGVPALASAIAPVVEIDGGTGAVALAPPLDAARFAEELVRLAADPVERRRLGAAGQARVRERFDVHRNMGIAFEALVRMRERWLAGQRSGSNDESGLEAAKVNIRT